MPNSVDMYAEMYSEDSRTYSERMWDEVDYIQEQMNLAEKKLRLKNPALTAVQTAAAVKEKERLQKELEAKAQEEARKEQEMYLAAEKQWLAEYPVPNEKTEAYLKDGGIRRKTK
jgi:hypothetical protein